MIRAGFPRPLTAHAQPVPDPGCPAAGAMQQAFPEADGGSGIEGIKHYPEYDGLLEAPSHDLLVKVLRQARDQSTGGLFKLN